MHGPGHRLEEDVSVSLVLALVVPGRGGVAGAAVANLSHYEYVPRRHAPPDGREDLGVHRVCALLSLGLLLLGQGLHGGVFEQAAAQQGQGRARAVAVAGAVLWLLPRPRPRPRP